MGCGHTYYRTKVGIFQPKQGEPGDQIIPDPYLRGRRPRANHLHRLRWLHDGLSPCAKNTLDLTYLYLAEKHGTRVFPETQVVSVKPLGDGE